jgi:hypothetical protein
MKEKKERNALSLYTAAWSGLGKSVRLGLFSIVQGGAEHWSIGLAVG